MVGLRHRFQSRAGDVTVLDGVDLHLDAGDHAALVGASGVGKTTLLSVLGGLESPQEGTVRVDDHDLAGMSRGELATFRRETVGFVFQHFGLLEALTAAENVELAGSLAGAATGPRRRRAAELLEAVGLGDRARHRPLELSGGERQRLAIARALMNRPRLVLADEPTGNLDTNSADGVFDVLRAVNETSGTTFLIVTHDPRLAQRCDRIIELVDGRIVSDRANMNVVRRSGAVFSESAGA
jgi:lipoprotein-releasing system ATP-binding protein